MGVGKWNPYGVKILQPEQHRALAFVDCCNANGHQPTAEELALWLASPDPKSAVYEGGASVISMMAQFAKTFSFGAQGAKLADAESPIDHLVRLHWIEATGEGGSALLRINRLGRALLLGAERSTETEPDLSVVVLGAEDPLAYPSLIGRLAGIEGGLLIDPFLGLEQLHELIQSTRISRMLVSDKSTSANKRAAMATYLRSGSVARSVEVRAAPGLHDRLVLSDRESFTLGTSLNGVGRTTTVLSPLPETAVTALLEEMEKTWAKAVPLVPSEMTEVTDS
jgi:hypothetical protein